MKVVDIHVHGGFGISFDNSPAGKINEFAYLAKSEGLMAFCPTLTGGSAEELRERLYNIKSAKTAQKKDEALIIGANLEGTFLSPKKPGAQNPVNFLYPNIENFKKISNGFEDIIKIVVIAPEIGDCLELIRYLKSKNIKVHFGHTQAKSLNGADCINHLYNAMDDIGHRMESLAVKALLNTGIYTEIIGDTIHVHPDVLKMTFKIRPLDKMILISDALPIAHSNLDFIEFCGKKVLNNGLNEDGTLAGSAKLLFEIADNLVEKEILPPETVYKAAFENPCRYLGLNLD